MSGILLIDEDRLVTEAVATVLNECAENTPVEYACGLTAGMSIFSRLQPKIVLSELEFSDGNLLSMIPRMRIENPACRIVALTNNDYDSYVEQALQAGIDGILLKTDALSTLNTTLAVVRSGTPFFSDTIRSRLRWVDSQWQLAFPRSQHVAKLSRRERQLLSYLGRGVSLKEAAADMRVCFKTADNQKASLMRKLNIHDRVELTLFAVREKFVSAQAYPRTAGTLRINQRQAAPQELSAASA